MSKLPKAPLIEVVLELKWKISEKADFVKAQYLYGDLFNILKKEFPVRESIVPPEIPGELIVNQPVHRFRTASNDYPLVQVGPGIVTLNFNNDKYFRDIFTKQTEEIIKAFLIAYPFKPEELVLPGIIFIDFFPFDFSGKDVYGFISEKFRITYKQDFIINSGHPKDLNIGFHYHIPLGDLTVVLHKGKDLKGAEGIVLQSRINGKAIKPDLVEIMKWVEDALDFSGDLFKRLTEGDLYESFKS